MEPKKELVELLTENTSVFPIKELLKEVNQYIEVRYDNGYLLLEHTLVYNTGVLSVNSVFLINLLRNDLIEELVNYVSRDYKKTREKVLSSIKTGLITFENYNSMYIPNGGKEEYGQLMAFMYMDFPQ